MNRLNKFVVFALVLFIGLGVACAAGVDDAGVDDATSSSVNEVVSETSMDSGNLPVEDVVGNNEDIDDTNAVSIQEDVTITSNNVNQYTNKNWTVGSHVTVTGSDDISLDNVAINIAGNYVTLNNLNITTTAGHANYIINANNFTNLTVKNSALTIINNNENTFGICLKDVSGALIENVELTVNAPSKSMDWNNYTIGEGDDAQTIWYSTPSVGAIVSDNSSNLNIHNNTISISKNGNYNAGSTMPAIILRNQTRYSTVNDNTITATGSTYNYGIMCNDYVNNLDITENRVSVTGEVYTAGIDVSTSTSSEVKYNNITATSINSSELASGSEALSYGIILATYQVQNNNNVISYNNIDLVANVGYGIENYMGSVNTIDYNNITINAKRGLGIATNASSDNFYRFNNIEINCNDNAVNYFYETIPAQNVGIIVIGANTNNMQFNNITINEDSSNTNTYAIILATDTSLNTVKRNNLYVYNTNGISKQGDLSILDSGLNNQISSNYPADSINQKNIKTDGELIIDENNVESYASITDYQWLFSSGSIPSNTNVIVNSPYSIKYIQFSLHDKTINTKFISNGLIRISATTTVVDTYLPGTRITTGSNGIVLINSTFLDTNNGPDKYPNRWTLENSTILTRDSNYIAIDDGYASPNYASYFDSTTHILLDNVDEGTTLVLRSMQGQATGNNSYTNAMIINKPVNILSYDNTTSNADITFVAGSEGSNITGLTFNGNLYINTSNINVKNNTINKGVFVNGGSGVVIGENTFNTDETAIVLVGAVETAIQNNNITTTSEYTITLDADSVENTVTGNNLQAATLAGVASVHDEGEDNTITDGGDEPVVVEPELRIDTTEFTVGSPAIITASIYKGDEVDSTISKGKVVFKVNGKTLKDANGKVIYAKVTGGVATITDYEVPSSWTKDNVTIQAVYSGSSQCDALRAEANLTVTKDTPAITTSDIQAYNGETVTLTATVTDGNAPVNVGKVVFKVNGKTVKDASGKVVYAKVVNGTVSVEYTIPENMKAGSYNITVSFTAPGYDKLVDTKTLTVSN